MRWIGRLQKRWRRQALPVGFDLSAWTETMRRTRPPAVAIAHPRWQGIASSTAHLFPAVLPIDHELSRREAANLTDALLEAEIPRVIFSGYSVSLGSWVESLARSRRAPAIYAFWHGSLMQSGERSSWQALGQLGELARAGRIARLAFAKSGMAEFFTRRGMPSAFLPNAIERFAPCASEAQAGGPHLGIWAVNAQVWRKLPYAMLAGAAEIPGAMLHASGAGARVAEYCQRYGLPTEVSAAPAPADEMPRRLASMHLNLYVTLSECSPMVPMESLAVGAPCLTGPNSHLFEDEPLLFSRLVVPFPDRHEVIGQYAARALDERDSIVEAYRRWAPSNWQRSLDALAAFLSLTPTEQAHWRQMGGQIWRDNGGWAQWGARYAPHDQCVLPRAA